MGWLLVMMLCTAGCKDIPVDKFDTQAECIASADRSNTKEGSSLPKSFSTSKTFYCIQEGEQRV